MSFRRLSLPLALILSAACARTQISSPMPVSQAAQVAATPVVPVADDPHQWLEDVEGEQALAWVRERNTRSLGTLQADPRYQRFYDNALTILEASDRIAFPAFRGTAIENFWRDATHVRGIWRTTTLASYRSANPAWTTILDVDSLAKAEGANWVYRGANCLPPADRRCLINLSDGGKDASVIREFDRETRTFVTGGFVFPESKGSVGWLDDNTVLVSRDFGPGTLTTSGYPFTTRVLSRGQRVEDAREVYRGTPSDVSAGVFALRDADGAVQAMIAFRGINFYDSEYSLVQSDWTRVSLPVPSRLSIRSLVSGQLVFSTESDWRGFTKGDLLAFDLAELKANPTGATPYRILHPGPRDAIQGTSSTRNRLIVSMTENVKGAVYSYQYAGNRNWSRVKLPLPDNSTLGIGSSSRLSDDLFFTASNYLTPNSLMLGNAAAATIEKVRSMPERFDASNLLVEQFEATSADGTKIPYFVTRPKTLVLDGNNPTVLYGYGGYQISLLPGYSPTLGKLWLEGGGVYVVANTRGGGEFGPSWHQAAQGQHRQRAHEDFIAVARDLIARKITSPRRLGIMGGSQGGLFMGVAMTQHPELFNAAVIQVPLFDMMRFHKLLAGASWIAEYGNPDIPEQRAWIMEYSPYQALAAGRKYPEAFIHTSTKDDRVHPGHARKAAARLEELGYPVLFYENTDGGHSAAANLRESARRAALEYTYLSRKLRDASPTP
ncbi:MAG: prolyl oligopeptidase family serine peptidase [Gemmatimonadaceae bacterium]